MKKQILITLILLAAFVSYGQSSGTPPPTPELAHYEFKETNPAFIVLSNTRELLNVDSADYYFTYDSTMYCRGGYYAVYDYARGFGDNSDMAGKQGFAYNEEMYVGFYDASENKYYNLTSDTKFTYKSLALYYVNDFKLGDEIELFTNPKLITSTLNYQYVPTSMDVYKDENLFFSVNSENMIDVKTTVLEGGGTLKVVDRWVNGHFVNRQYTALDADKVVKLKTTGKNIFTGEVKEIYANVVVTSSKPAPVENNDTTIVLYSCDRFKLVSKPFRNYGDYIFIESLTDAKVWLSITFTRKNGSRIGSTLRSDSNGGRGIAIKDMESAMFYKAWFDGKVEYLNRETITF